MIGFEVEVAPDDGAEPAILLLQGPEFPHHPLEFLNSPLLITPHIQSLNDLAGGFDVIRQMRVMPFGPALVLVLIGATLLPMAPLVFLEFPLDELLELAAKLILGAG